MADFFYTPSGGVNFRGESDSYYLGFEHQIGDIVYIKYKIIRYLLLEKVAIKKILTNSNKNNYVIVYIDTFNRAWLDGELLKESEALALLNIYS